MDGIEEMYKQFIKINFNDVSGLAVWKTICIGEKAD